MPEREIEARSDHLAIVRALLDRHVPDREVWAFGSRVSGTAKPHSDLDLVIFGDAPLDIAVAAALEKDLRESDLPWKVDVVDWATTSEPFRRIMERDRIMLQPARVRSA